MELRTQFDPPAFHYEKPPTGTSKVEPGLYRSTAEEVNLMLAAGKALMLGRAEAYNSELEQEKEDFYNEDTSDDNVLLGVKPMTIRQVRSDLSRMAPPEPETPLDPKTPESPEVPSGDDLFDGEAN